jgi:hypothetical protein
VWTCVLQDPFAEYATEEQLVVYLRVSPADVC